MKSDKIDLKMIVENCRFFLVRKNKLSDNFLPYKLEDFEKL